MEWTLIQVSIYQQLSFTGVCQPYPQPLSVRASGSTLNWWHHKHLLRSVTLNMLLPFGIYQKLKLEEKKFRRCVNSVLFILPTKYSKVHSQIKLDQQKCVHWDCLWPLSFLYSPHIESFHWFGHGVTSSVYTEKHSKRHYNGTPDICTEEVENTVALHSVLITTGLRRNIIFARNAWIVHLFRDGYVFNFMNSEKYNQSSVPFHLVSRMHTKQSEAHLLQE